MNPKKKSKYIDKEIALEKKIKELDNIVYKVGQSAQTVHMLTKPQVFYDDTHKQALGYQNPFYLKKAQRIKPTLYDGSVISSQRAIIHVIDDEETLILEENLEGVDLLLGSRDTNLDTISLDDMLKTSLSSSRQKPSKTKSGVDFTFIASSFYASQLIEDIRIFVANAVNKNMTIYQMDIKTAFLNGKKRVPKKVLFSQQSIIDQTPHHMCTKLKKALYGLKQAPHTWYDMLSSFLISQHFSKDKQNEDLQGTPVDATLYRGIMWHDWFPYVSDIHIFCYLKGTINMGLWYDEGYRYVSNSYQTHITLWLSGHLDVSTSEKRSVLVSENAKNVLEEEEDEVMVYGALIPDEMINQDIKDSKAYETYLAFAIGQAAPKKAGKFKKIASPSKKLSPVLEEEPYKSPNELINAVRKSLTVPTAGVVITDTPGVSMSKKKALAKADRGKVHGFYSPDCSKKLYLKLLSSRKLLRKSKQETQKLHASGSGDGVGFNPRFLMSIKTRQMNDDEEEYVRTPDNYEFSNDDEEYEELYIDRIPQSFNVPQFLPKEESDFATPGSQSTITESIKNFPSWLKSSSQPQSTYEAAASLTEFELKKILLDKIHKGKSYRGALEHKELYDALTWMNRIAHEEKPPLTFDELMSTLVDFSAYVMNNMKIENLKQEHLVGPAFNLLKGTCRSRVELEYNFEECYKAKRVEDLQLGVESCQKKLNITKPETFRSDISNMTPYTAYNNPQGIIYQDKYKRNRLMRSDKLYKFSDGTLTSIRTVLHDIASNLRMDYLPKRRWSKLDRKMSCIMIKAIDQQLFESRLMRNLEKFVSGIDYGEDLRRLEWKI
ncbi:retrovirus-related pol polyprotein from transposon TNT 1-94 [Tanacetum coccineum]